MGHLHAGGRLIEGALIEIGRKLKEHLMHVHELCKHMGMEITGCDVIL